MFIRSQDKKLLIEPLEITILNSPCSIVSCAQSGDYYEPIGNYSTPERTIEVLDEIQDAILNGHKTFIMPKE